MIPDQSTTIYQHLERVCRAIHAITTDPTSDRFPNTITIVRQSGLAHTQLYRLPKRPDLFNKSGKNWVLTEKGTAVALGAFNLVAERMAAINATAPYVKFEPTQLPESQPVATQTEPTPAPSQTNAVAVSDEPPEPSKRAVRLAKEWMIWKWPNHDETLEFRSKAIETVSEIVSALSYWLWSKHNEDVTQITSVDS